jgi:hypothetical protein
MPTRLNALDYLNFLNNVLPQLLEDLPLEIANICMMVSHVTMHGRTYAISCRLDRMKWSCSLAWPIARVDQCDFFLWGYMKELVCSTPDDTLEIFQERVENAAELIRNNGVMLARVEESFCRLPQA